MRLIPPSVTAPATAAVTSPTASLSAPNALFKDVAMEFACTRFPPASVWATHRAENTAASQFRPKPFRI